MGEIKPMPITAAQALKIIRATAKNSSNIGMPKDLGFSRPYQEWQHLVTDRQIERCIEAGEIIGKPRIDKFGNILCKMFRFGGGEEVSIEIVLVKEADRDWRIFVTGWSKSDGNY